MNDKQESVQTNTGPTQQRRLFGPSSRYSLAILLLLAINLAAAKRLWQDVVVKLFYESHEAVEIGVVKWRPCTTFPNIDCGTIVVPKDYFNPEAGTATIALGRYRATGKRKGSLFTNPGGPGAAGVVLATKAGPNLAKLVGDQWDIIGFDPRGVGETKPSVHCFPDPETQELFIANSAIEQPPTISSISNLSSVHVRESLIQQYRQVLALKKTQAELCRKNMGDELRYMGTPTVVRDIDFMSKIFDGEDAPINFWSGSYGSILGMYLVNMLPAKRIGYVSIDGIADPVSWANEPSHKWPRNWLSSTEKTYEWFLRDCIKVGPSLCPLAKFADTSEGLEARIEEFLDALALSPLPVPFGRKPGILTSGGVRGLLLIFLQAPSTWPKASRYLAEAMASGDGTSLFNLITPNASYSQDLSRLAVTCLDSPPPKSSNEIPTAEDLADEGLKTLREVSPHFGVSTGLSEPDGGCQYWPVKGPERFTGPWNATLRTPMLVISNTADPITPIASGLLVNSLMPNSSILVIQNSPGHTSSQLSALCTSKIVKGYYAGNFPRNGTVCEMDRSPFSDAPTYDLKSLTISDQELLDASRDLGKAMWEARRPWYV